MSARSRAARLAAQLDQDQQAAEQYHPGDKVWVLPHLIETVESHLENGPNGERGYQMRADDGSRGFIPADFIIRKVKQA